MRETAARSVSVNFLSACVITSTPPVHSMVENARTMVAAGSMAFAGAPRGKDHDSIRHSAGISFIKSNVIFEYCFECVS